MADFSVEMPPGAYHSLRTIKRYRLVTVEEKRNLKLHI